MCGCQRSLENRVRDLVRQGVSQQPAMIIVRIRPPAQFVAYEDYSISGSKPENVSACEIGEFKLVPFGSLAILGNRDDLKPDGSNVIFQFLIGDRW